MGGAPDATAYIIGRLCNGPNNTRYFAPIPMKLAPTAPHESLANSVSIELLHAFDAIARCSWVRANACFPLSFGELRLENNYCPRVVRL
jgi:hypothetical protein